MKPINHLSPTQARWFAVYTGYKREKVVERLLREKGIEVYLPLQKFARRYTRKVRQVELPLFSCYIFVKIVKQEYVPILETQYVHGFVKIKKDLIAIPEKEIEIVKRVVGEVKELEVLERCMKPGEEVEIIGGKLTGLKGKLIGRNGKQKFIMELQNLGFGLEMEVNSELLRKSRYIKTSELEVSVLV